MESRTQGSRPRTQKKFRGQGPRTQTQMFSKKERSSKIFLGVLYLRKPKKRSLQIFCKVSGVFQRNFNDSKIVLFLSQGLEAVSTRKLDHFPGEPHGYLLRSLTPGYWPSIDFSDVAALSNSNIQQTIFNQIFLKTETNRQQNI